VGAVMADNKLDDGEAQFLTQDNSSAPGSVVVHLDNDVVEQLKQRFGDNWKAAASAILKKAALDL
jgi:hypothetical protein